MNSQAISLQISFKFELSERAVGGNPIGTPPTPYTVNHIMFIYRVRDDKHND